MADEWSAFKQRPAAPADTADPWASFKVQRTQPFPEKPEGYPYLTPDTAQAAMPAIKGAVEPILNAFGQGFREGWGPQRIGIPDQDVHWLSKVGIFAPENQSSYTNPFHAFNELLAETIWRTPEIAMRGISGLYRGFQAAGVEAGIPKDIVSMPEAFFGSPHPTGIPKTLPEIPEPTLDLGKAQDLGVIGETPKPRNESTPQEAAHASVPDKTMAAEQQTKPEDVIHGPSQMRDKAGNIRLDQIGINGDAKDIIVQAAESNNDFMNARQGNVPLAQVERLSEASGVPSTELSGNDGLGRLMHNDAVVRTWLQAFHQATDEIAEQARKVKETGADTDVEKLREMKLRFQHMQEQVSGLTAEAGRTLRVFRDFYEAKGKAEAFSKVLEENPGNDVKSIKKMADALDATNNKAGFLNDMRQPTFWDKAMWYWVNNLISGPFTHAKYVMANAAFAGYEAVIVTPLAAALGTARKLVGAEAQDRVYHGEEMARLYGLVIGTPDAVRASVQAFKSGLQTPLPGELAQNIIPKQNRSIFFQQKPIPGAFGTIMSAPSRGASGIHSFFNFLGYRASIEQQAYAQTVKEGLKVTDDTFWRRRGDIASNPTVEMMDKANEEGYRLTFINELSPGAKAVANLVNKIPVVRLVMPFVHIPFNILNRSLDSTVLSVFGESARKDILGKNGTRAQDMQIARVVAGSAFGVWIMNQVLNDRATGYGPTNREERERWFATGHQPYSIRIGDHWYSYNKFGPLGTLLGLHANLAEVAPHLKWDGEEMTKASAMLVHNAGRLMEDEVGMQGLAGLLDMIDDPERKGARVASNFVASWLPYSSALRQIAGFQDPYLRETKTFIDGLRYAIPSTTIGRESLYLKRNALTGDPIPNPAAGSIIRTGSAIPDPLALEMKELEMPVAQPVDRIGGIKLTPAINDKYQAIAGGLVRQYTDMIREAPDWPNLPPFVRQLALKGAIKSARQAAAAAIQVTHPQIIEQAIKDREDQIAGQKPKKKLVQ